MKAKRGIQKIGGMITNASATLAMGFLSLVGMCVLTPSILLCGGAFIFAIAYESQVNGEGINRTFKKIFDPNYPALDIIADYLENKILEIDIATVQQSFLKDYIQLRNYIQALEEYIRHLSDAQKSYLAIGEERKSHQHFHHLAHEKEEELRFAKRRLRNMQLFFLKNLKQTEAENSDIELQARDAANHLFTRNEQEKLLQEIKRKTWAMRITWLPALGAGISFSLNTLSIMKAGIATLSMIKIGMLSFSFISTIPGGIFIALAVAAGIGYTSLVYNSTTEIIQKYGSIARNYFKRRPHETGWKHKLRCTALIFGVLVGVGATLATAGTWWYGVKEGAAILGAIGSVAEQLRNFTVPSFLAPTNLIFTTYSNTTSINNITKSSYKEWIRDAAKNLKQKWRAKNMIRFLNPPWLAATIVATAYKTVAYLLHCIFLAAMSDRIKGIPPIATIPVNGLGEALTDAAYLPKQGHGHSHDSIFLKALLFPGVAAVSVLKFAAVIWDYAFSYPRNFKSSMREVFCTPLKKRMEEPAKPQPSFPWRKHEFIQRCQKISSHIKRNKPQKAFINEIRQHAENHDNENAAIQDQFAIHNQLVGLSAADMSISTLKANVTIKTPQTFFQTKTLKSMNRALEDYYQSQRIGAVH